MRRNTNRIISIHSAINNQTSLIESKEEYVTELFPTYSPEEQPIS
jgi:hypothetical protein